MNEFDKYIDNILLKIEEKIDPSTITPYLNLYFADNTICKIRATHIEWDYYMVNVEQEILNFKQEYIKKIKDMRIKKINEILNEKNR